MTDEKPVIIDWHNATIGNPLADVARSALLLKPAVPPIQTFGAKVLRIMQHWFCRVYVKRYFQLVSVDRQEFEAWYVVNAAALLEE